MCLKTSQDEGTIISVRQENSDRTLLIINGRTQAKGHITQEHPEHGS